MPKIKKAWSLLHHPALFVAVLVVFWLPVIVFSKLAGEVMEREPISADNVILFWIHSHASPALDQLFLGITSLGNPMILGPIILLIIGWLLYIRHRRDAAIVFLSVAGAVSANFILKLLFQRDRPTFWHSLVTETSYSFPSGHAMITSALILAIIAISWHTRARWFIVVSGLVIMAAIGISRLYLGVHYPSDVVAGWCVSAVWVFVVYLLVTRGSTRLHRKE